MIFITHPEVQVDPGRDVTRWHLSDRGIARMRAFAETAPRFSAIWASTETKAIEAAGILAAAQGIGIQVHEGLGENDRSATGFLPPNEFENAADAFFAYPETSFRGWETALAAQARVVTAWQQIALKEIAVVAHGAVGTLLRCHLAGLPISRQYDQPGQGHYWRIVDGQPTGWQPLT